MKNGKILWSFNPFQENTKVLKKTVALLKALSEQTGMAVEPVFVVSPAEVNIVLEFSVPSQDRYRAVALAECRLVLKKVSFPSLLPPKVLVERQLRLSASAQALANYARKTGAHAIVVGTQGKKGLGRVLLGSFAETLLTFSRTPVLFVNPQLRLRKPLKRFLFASDLSPDSKKVFANFCRFARPLRAEILLYHFIPKPFPWASEATQYLLGTKALSELEYLLELRKQRGQKAQSFLTLAKKNRLKASLSMESSDEDLTEAVLRQAKRVKADGIALAAQTGLWETALLGSTSRGVLREATIPVWVLRHR